MKALSCMYINEYNDCVPSFQPTLNVPIAAHPQQRLLKAEKSASWE
jgi:hypothetical protein